MVEEEIDQVEEDPSDTTIGGARRHKASNIFPGTETVRRMTPLEIIALEDAKTLPLNEKLDLILGAMCEH